MQKCPFSRRFVDAFAEKLDFWLQMHGLVRIGKRQAVIPPRQSVGCLSYWHIVDVLEQRFTLQKHEDTLVVVLRKSSIPLTNQAFLKVDVRVI